MEKMDETSHSMCENVKVTQMYHNIHEVGERVQLVEESIWWKSPLVDESIGG